LSTILDALRRLQTERASGPGVDPREALGRRNLAPSGRVALRGIGVGAVLGAASVALLTALWLLSGAVFPSTAGEPPQDPRGEIRLAQASAPPPEEPIVRADVEPAPEDELADPPDLIGDSGDGGDEADSQTDPGTPLTGAAAARLQRVRLTQDERARASEQAARPDEPTAGENAQEESSGYQAIAERQPEGQPPAATAETGAGVSSLSPPRQPAPPAPANRPPPRARPAAPAAGPRPAATRPRRTRPPARAEASSNLTPGRSSPPAGEPGYVDPVVFPALAVNSVRWHPDPARRQATVEVDGVVAIAAREGERVGGALLSRIDPGQVEFRIGTRAKVVPVGK
jgi:hypothetical protein